MVPARGLIAGVVAGLLTALPAAGQFGSKFSQTEDAPLVTVELIAEAPAVVPGGTTTIGLRFQIREGWHTYAPNQNDTGTPARVDWTIEGAEGITISDLAWPAGQRYEQPGDILDHVYEHEVLAVAVLETPEDLAIGDTVTIRGDLEWLVCSADRCVPEFDEVKLELPVAAAVRAAPSPAWTAAYSGWEIGRGALVSGDRSDDVAVRWDGQTLVVSTPHAARLSFMPIDGAAEVENLMVRGVTSGQELRIRFKEPESRPDVHAWIRLSPHEKHADGEPPAHDAHRPWSSDVWVLSTQFGRAPARIIGEPMMIPDRIDR